MPCSFQVTIGKNIYVRTFLYNDEWTRLVIVRSLSIWQGSRVWCFFWSLETGGSCQDGSYVISKIRLNFVSPEAASDWRIIQCCRNICKKSWKNTWYHSCTTCNFETHESFPSFWGELMIVSDQLATAWGARPGSATHSVWSQNSGCSWDQDRSSSYAARKTDPSWSFLFTLGFENETWFSQQIELRNSTPTIPPSFFFQQEIPNKAPMQQLDHSSPRPDPQERPSAEEARPRLF